jgi:Na+(H+)/acetate symporter ActP
LLIPTQRLNIALLVALAFAVVASANLPALLYNLLWKRFNTMGATFSIYGGLIMAVLLVTFHWLCPAHLRRWSRVRTSTRSCCVIPG